MIAPPPVSGRCEAGRPCHTPCPVEGPREAARQTVLRPSFAPWRFLAGSLLAVGLLAIGLLAAGAAGQDLPPGEGDPLAAFAHQVLEANREVAAAREDLEAARHQFRKVPTRFQPTLTVGETSAKSANRNYNDLTGLDEDYTTRQRGTTVGIRQETPIGTGRFEMTRTLTEYTQAQTSHFQSAYLTLERGLLKRPDRRITLDRRIGRQEYQVTRTRTSGQVQQTLLEAFRALFQRLIAAEEFRFRERSLAFYASLVEEAEVKLQSGLGSELDLKQARMRRTQAETGLEQSRLDLAEADRKVGLVLGRPDWDRALASFTPAAVAAQVPADLDPQAVLREGLPTRLDLRQADAQLGLARDTVRLAREQARPDLDLSVRWGRQGRATLAEMARDMRDRNWDVSLTWSQPLGPDPDTLDRRSEERRLAATALRRTQAEEAGRQAILEAVARIGFHRQRVRDLTAAAGLSAEVLEGQRLNFQLGKTSLLDLSRYQSDHEEACLAVVRAEAELILGWLALLSETGLLADRFADDGAAWPPAWLPAATRSTTHDPANP
ncbi:MAG: TolC family protein [Candidatus Riflebacteria bacterium]|nr:TolC family protein [Candidatus Riflebacteria bacterium]